MIIYAKELFKKSARDALFSVVGTYSTCSKIYGDRGAGDAAAGYR